MSDEHTETGTGWPTPSIPAVPSGPAAEPDPRPEAPPADGVGPLVGVPGADPATPANSEPAEPETGLEPAVGGPPSGTSAAGRATDPAPAVGSKRPSAAGLMIAVLLALLGFTLVVQLKTSSTDPTLGATRQEDLVRILSDLEAQEQRLRQDISGLEDSQRQLASGAQSRQAALDEATRRGDELGILAGTLPARGPGLSIQFAAAGKPIRAATLLDAVQELRGAGAEAMQIAGGGGEPVRIVASTYFLDAEAGVNVGGRQLVGPYTITVIGEPQTMQTALNIAGGVVASVRGDGGTVMIQERDAVDVEVRSVPTSLKYARPVS